MKALIVVDIQNDFLPGGKLAVDNGDVIIPEVNSIQEEYDLVVATQDWHPRGHKSFASSHAGRNVFDEVELHGLSQTLWPDHCVQGTVGAEFSATLDTRCVEAVFRKGMDIEIDSYSGFFDNGRFKNTGLDGYLKGRGVTEVDVCGLAADYCVYFTAIDALSLGYTTGILENATQSIRPERFEMLKNAFREKGGIIR